MKYITESKIVSPKQATPGSLKSYESKIDFRSESLPTDREMYQDHGCQPRDQVFDMNDGLVSPSKEAAGNLKLTEANIQDRFSLNVRGDFPMDGGESY